MLPKWQDIPPKGALKMALSHETWPRTLRKDNLLMQVRDDSFIFAAVFVKWELIESRFPQPRKDLPQLFGAVGEASIASSQQILRSTDMSMPVMVFNTNNLSPSGAVVPAGLLVPQRFWETLRHAVN
jgi:hypothetical protein